MKEQVKQALDKIHPALQADDGDVQVWLTGACAGCPLSQMTLTAGVEKAIKQVVPGINRVMNV